MMGLPETTCLELYVSETDVNRIIKQNILSTYISAQEVYRLLGYVLESRVLVIENILMMIGSGRHENKGIRIVLKTHNPSSLVENLDNVNLPFTRMKQLNEYEVI